MKAILLPVGKLLNVLRQDYVMALDLATLISVMNSSAEQFRVNISPYAEWLEQKSNLIGCWTFKPFFNGKKLSDAFHLTGPEIGQIMQKQVEWQLEHPAAMRDETNCQVHSATCWNFLEQQAKSLQ